MILNKLNVPKLVSKRIRESYTFQSLMGFWYCIILKPFTGTLNCGLVSVIYETLSEDVNQTKDVLS